MGILACHFGTKSYFNLLSDEKLLDNLALAVEGNFYSAAFGIHSMLSVIRARLAENKDAHPALVPVGARMKSIESERINYCSEDVIGGLKGVLRSRYARKYAKWDKLRL